MEKIDTDNIRRTLKNLGLTFQDVQTEREGTPSTESCYMPEKLCFNTLPQKISK